jgi:hypothetical protein|tara:strand:- start:880 stop:1218 length:339 start_codon:yes stop_codon:yes gene_type:complete
MTAATYDLVIDQGSDFAIDLTITEAGSAKNLTGYSGRAQVRSTHAASSTSATFSVTIVNASTGQLKMEMTAATSGGLAAGRYVYDLEIHTANNATVKRLIQGSVTINPEVTR